MPRSLPGTMQQFKRVGAEQQTKLLEMGAWWLAQKIFEATPLKTFESAPFNKYLLLYAHSYTVWFWRDFDFIKTGTFQNCKALENLEITVLVRTK